MHILFFKKVPYICNWTHGLWWLILCVDLMELRDAQITGKILFLGVSMRVFLEEISFELETKEIPLINAGEPHSICWKPKKNQKVEERLTLSLSWDTDLLLPSDIHAASFPALGLEPGLTTPGPLVFRLQTQTGSSIIFSSA